MAEIKYYVFFDFEMLCSNDGMLFTDMEAIRLGAVKYELTTHSLTTFDSYIKPLNSAPLSSFCKKLTGITDHDLINAKSFPEVFEDFLAWVGGVKKTQFFSWSKSDLSRLKLDSDLHQTPQATIKKIEQRYVDLQAVITNRVTKTQLSVENALKEYNLDFIGETHNPMYDAYNTFRIFMSFIHLPKKSDLLMIKHFILKDINTTDYDEINSLLKENLKKDITILTQQIRDISRLKDTYKLLKKSIPLVKKYDNILINRSNLFSSELILYVRLFQQLFKNLMESYKEHAQYYSKVIMFDEHTLKELKQLSVAI